MKYLVALFLLITGGANAQDIHYKSIVVDTHNDCITACIEKKVSLDQDLTGINHSDLKRFKEGGLDYQLFSVWCDGEKAKPYAWAMRSMDTLEAVANRNTEFEAIINKINNHINFFQNCGYSPSNSEKLQQADR